MDPLSAGAGTAACADVLGLVDKAFDRPGGHHADILKERFCGHCEIAEQCLIAAARGTEYEFGVWGGTSPKWRTEHGGPKSPSYQKEQRKRLKKRAA